MKKNNISYDQVLFFLAFLGLAAYKNYPLMSANLSNWIMEISFVTLFTLIALSIKSNVQLFTAHLWGDINVKIQRKLSFWPFRFIDITGIICAVFLQMGWSKIVSSDKALKGSQSLTRSVIVLSGPLSNLIIALVLKLFISPIENFSLSIAAFLELFVRIQFQFGIFNLLPIPPLDGWLILVANLKRNIKPQDYRNYGLMLLLILFNYQILQDMVFGITNFILSFF